MKKGNGGIAWVSGSCTVLMCNVTIEVYRSEHICLPDRLFERTAMGLFE